jgi:DNA end-binding protein Ku
MMRSMWKGTIAFGMVTVPVKMYKATESNGIEFHQCHRDDGGRIRTRRFCSICSDEVPYSDIVKGYEMSEGHNIIITDEEMADLPINTLHSIEVHSFVPSADIPVIYMSGQHYYLAPESAGGKRAYALLRGALHATDLTAVVRFTIRNRERLGVLRPDGDVIVLEVLNWFDEIREPDTLPNLTEVPPLTTSEVKMARKLVEAMRAKFDPHEHTDAYRDALNTLVEAKVAGTPAVRYVERDAQPSSMEAMLNASLNNLKKGNNE